MLKLVIDFSGGDMGCDEAFQDEGGLYNLVQKAYAEDATISGDCTWVGDIHCYPEAVNPQWPVQGELTTTVGPLRSGDNVSVEFEMFGYGTTKDSHAYGT